MGPHSGILARRTGSLRCELSSAAVGLGLREWRNIRCGSWQGTAEVVFLPEPHTDFILAVIGEELGLIGSVTIMLLYCLLILKGFQIAERARTPFGRYLAMGITMLIGTQALINAGVVTGLLPTKGLTLPFVSYGGSSLLANLFGVGILLNISRDRQGGRESGESRRRRKWDALTS